MDNTTNNINENDNEGTSSAMNPNNLNHLYSLSYLLNSDSNEIQKALGINIKHVNEDNDEDEIICRICFSNEKDELKNPIINPCKCKGPNGNIHLKCLH